MKVDESKPEDLMPYLADAIIDSIDAQMTMLSVMGIIGKAEVAARRKSLKRAFWDWDGKQKAV